MMRKVGWLQNTVGPVERHRFAKMHKRFTIPVLMISIKCKKTFAIQANTLILFSSALDVLFNGLDHLEVEGISKRTDCLKPCYYRKYRIVQKGMDFYYQFIHFFV